MRSMQHLVRIVPTTGGGTGLRSRPLVVSSSFSANPVLGNGRTAVARALLRRSEWRDRDVGQEVADLTQDVFVTLFGEDARILRSWDPDKGMSLLNFVGLLAERCVASILRSGKHRLSGWLSPDGADSFGVVGSTDEATVPARLLLQQLLEALEATLSPRGMELFVLLYAEAQSVEEICAHTGLKPAAVHQWRHRLREAAKAVLRELERASGSPFADRGDERARPMAAEGKTRAATPARRAARAGGLRGYRRSRRADRHQDS